MVCTSSCSAPSAASPTLHSERQPMPWPDGVWRLLHPQLSPHPTLRKSCLNRLSPRPLAQRRVEALATPAVSEPYTQKVGLSSWPHASVQWRAGALASLNRFPTLHSESLPGLEASGPTVCRG